jgi:hypothetical protein
LLSDDQHSVIYGSDFHLHKSLLIFFLLHHFSTTLNSFTAMIRMSPSIFSFPVTFTVMEGPLRVNGKCKPADVQALVLIFRFLIDTT